MILLYPLNIRAHSNLIMIPEFNSWMDILKLLLDIFPYLRSPEKVLLMCITFCLPVLFLIEKKFYIRNETDFARNSVSSEYFPLYFPPCIIIVCFAFVACVFAKFSTFWPWTFSSRPVYRPPGDQGSVSTAVATVTTPELPPGGSALAANGIPPQGAGAPSSALERLDNLIKVNS